MSIESRRRANKKWRLANKERCRAIYKNWYDRHRAQDLCVRCPAPNNGKSVHCDKHQIEHDLRRRNK